MNWKRFWAAALAALMCLSLCACGQKPGAASSSPAGSVSASASASAEPEAPVLPLDGPMYFTFASGAGGWGTEIELLPDGSFTGSYHDSDMGDTGEKYPYGTLYYCSFTGRFANVEQADPYCCTMTLVELEQEVEADLTTIGEDGIRYISSFPYGLAKVGSTYRLYQPETPLDGLSEEFLSWWPLRYDQAEEGRKTLSCWGILNEEEEFGFFSFDEDAHLEVPIPEDIAPLVTVDEGPSERDDAYHTTLITVSETASLEAGQKQHPGEDWGDGWLFSIARLNRVGLERFLGYEDSGFAFFAARDDGSAYYLLETPTDVRLNRLSEEEFNNAISQWGSLCQWADGIPEAVLEANPDLIPFSAQDVLGDGFLYEGEHPVALYEDPDDGAGGNVMIFLSQPVRQGEGGVWCVERVQYLFSAGMEAYILPVFPVSMGHAVPAADYYVQLQAECDAGQHPELLTPEGALEDFVRTSDSWLYDAECSMDLFRFVEPEG